MDPLVKAVRDLRQHLGDSQQAFANRLGLSIRAIANYEKDRRPTGSALAALAHAAQSGGHELLAGRFFTALMEELRLTEFPFNRLALSNRDGELCALMLANVKSKRKVEYLVAFWKSLIEDLDSAKADVRARAEKRLDALKAATNAEPHRRVPDWAKERPGE